MPLPLGFIPPCLPTQPPTGAVLAARKSALWLRVPTAECQQICALHQVPHIEALPRRSVASMWYQHQEICSAGEFCPAVLVMDPSQPTMSSSHCSMCQDMSAIS